MKLGIISDTHNNIESTKKACEIFREKNVDLVVHAGDISSAEIIELFRDFNCKFVIGNADVDINLINKECKDLGLTCYMESCELEIEGKRILFMHGNVVSVFRDAVASGKYNYIIKGHTHYFENYIRNNTRIINPGSLQGSEDYSIAILDLNKDEVEKINISK